MPEINIQQSALSFPVFFEKKEEYTLEDSRFTKVKIWLMHLGKNKNNSVFEKDVVDAAIDTLEYIPIVGFIEKNNEGENDFSDHRYIITKDKKGVRRKYLGSAYGVILSSEDNNAHYEDRICDDGETRTFLVVDGVIWNMFEDSAEIMDRDLIKPHSMELKQDTLDSYDGYEDEEGAFHFTKFSFRAACILGENKEPAMINSTVEVQFTMTDFVKDLQAELNDKYTAFTKLVNEKSNQGGIEIMPNTNFSQTVLEQFSDISAIVSQYESVSDRWGNAVPRFYLSDIQENEAIVVDRKNNYRYYGLSFTLNGDKPEIDFASAVRKKLQYANYEEGSDAPEGFDFGKHIEEIETVAYEKVEEAAANIATAEEAKNRAEAEYTAMKADYDDMKPKYDKYVKADEERQEEELKAQKDAVFAKFETKLGELAEFTELKSHKEELSVEDIENKCSVLYVKADLAANANFTKQKPAAIVDVMNLDADSDLYVDTIYGRIPVKR